MDNQNNINSNINSNIDSNIDKNNSNNSIVDPKNDLNSRTSKNEALSNLEEMTGIDFGGSNEERELAKATGGKPARVFPMLISDYELYAYWDKDLYHYNGKHYDRFDDFDIDRMVRKFYLDYGLTDNYSTSKAKELKAMIKFDPRIIRTEFDNYDSLVNLNNGIFNYEDRSLIPHDYHYKFTYFLDVDYNRNASSCPVFINFLKGCFADSGSWEEGYEYDEVAYENVLRLCGYLLFPKVVKQMEALFIFIGEGSNGKSVLIDTLKMFFPPKYVTNLSLNAISNEDGFTREKLINSRINFCQEQRGGSINSEELKKIASGEGITVQRKFNQAMDINSRTKICVSTNNMPYFNDTTYGILRRLKIFNFKNKFMSDKDFHKEVNPSTRRIFKGVNKEWVMNEIKKERPAIFNLFLDAFYRFQKDEWKFLPSKNMTEILEEYKSNSDIMYSWLEENYEFDENEDFIGVDIKEVYNKFRLWYEDNFNKRCGYSMLALSKKIRDKYRVDDPIVRYEYDNYSNKRKKVTAYPLRQKAESEALRQLMEISNENKNKEEEMDNKNQRLI